MIDSLTGKLLKKTTDTVVICCAGVGYRALVPSGVAATLPGVGSETTLFTHMHITENDISLFGFESEQQRSCFELLIGVSGVGPKVGIAILNVLSPDRIILSISGSDHKPFTTASGVGPKLAQRIVLELKDKVNKGNLQGLDMNEMVQSPVASSGGEVSKAIAALVGLGYSTNEAASAIAKCDSDLSVEEMIRSALQRMAPGR